MCGAGTTAANMRLYKNLQAVANFMTALVDTCWGLLTPPLREAHHLRCCWGFGIRAHFHVGTEWVLMACSGGHSLLIDRPSIPQRNR